MRQTHRLRALTEAKEVRRLENLTAGPLENTLEEHLRSAMQSHLLDVCRVHGSGFVFSLEIPADAAEEQDNVWVSALRETQSTPLGISPLALPVLGTRPLALQFSTGDDDLLDEPTLASPAHGEITTDSVAHRPVNKHICIHIFTHTHVYT